MKFLRRIPHHLQYQISGFIVAIWAGKTWEFLLPPSPNPFCPSGYMALSNPSFWLLSLEGPNLRTHCFSPEQWQEFNRQGTWLWVSVMLCATLLPFFIARRFEGELGWLVTALLFVVALISAVALPSGMVTWSESGAIHP